MAAATKPHMLLTSPPAKSGSARLREWLGYNLPRCDVLALNLHGFLGESAYYGQVNDDIRPVALRAVDVWATADAWKGLDVFCEVCFSASADSPLPQAMYDCGARVVIGSRTEAYGRTKSTLPLPGFDGEADRLLAFFLTWRRRINDPSRALRAAKKMLRVWSFPLDKEDRATLKSFTVIQESEK